MPNIFDFDSLFRRTLLSVGLTGSLVKISLTPVSVKTLLVLTHVTVENKTNAYTKVRLGVDARGVIHYIDELITVAAAELVVSRSDILLTDGDYFFAELTGTTDGDELILTSIGWKVKL
ncbi:hypothetical protein LCGC14_0817780 [marine sediment metagenome]|uniref:Uncharacterized protein n=1 Tax=marine sediment metagenome TaxID=412755 RepID=A0A0F9PPF1_9ZZZZ|nr:hypothetical protein [Desulfobacterales bacterium]